MRTPIRVETFESVYPSELIFLYPISQLLLLLISYKQLKIIIPVLPTLKFFKLFGTN